MLFMIFHYFLDSHSPFFSKKMKKHSKLSLNMEELRQKAGQYLKSHHISINTTLYVKILCVALSGLVLICNFFEET